LNEDYFKDLINFGSSIEKKEVNQRKKLRGSSKKSKNHYSRPNKIKPWIVAKKTIKKLVSFVDEKSECLRDGFFKVFLRKRKKLSVIKKTVKKNNWRHVLNFSDGKKFVTGYKLVEKKKQRGNKIVITRKRVRVKINKDDVGPPNGDLQDLIHLTFESGLYYHRENTNYFNHGLKKSIWDFKIK